MDKLKQWDMVLLQAKFPFNSMINRSIGKFNFAIMYTKVPNHTLDLITLQKLTHQATESMVEQIKQTHEKVRRQLEDANAKYKATTDQHRKKKIFQKGDMIMVHLCKLRFPTGSYQKLHAKNIGPLHALKKLNDNAAFIELPSDSKSLPHSKCLISMNTILLI